MLKILYWLLFDGFFIYALLSFHDELGGYLYLLLAFIAFFTWELVAAVRNWIK